MKHPGSSLSCLVRNSLLLLACCLLPFFLNGCARMGQPDGGWYDETPPYVVGSSPTDGATGIKSRKISIDFNEFIKIDNPTENVVVSPPQVESPEIKAQGKHIIIELKDTLKENTTYTVDFSDAITDNNEGNPLGNYTYTFSTGEVIDTMEIGGYVLDAETLEPVKGIQVGLYDDLSDTAFVTKPFLRVSRTNDSGRFVIKGVAPGNYKVYALQDADGNYMFSQKSETLAFSDEVVTPSSKPDVRQDTIWRDSLHILNISQTNYTHFLPDDIVLRAFTENLTDRYLLKSERTNPNRFTLIFSYGSTQLPTLKPLNFDERVLKVEHNAKRDTINYWIADTAVVNTDSLNISLTYEATDTTGVLQQLTDTLLLLPKLSYEKRLKQEQKQLEDWQKQQEKLKKKGEPYDSIPPVEPLKPKVNISSKFSPDQNVKFVFPTPVASIDTTKIKLYVKIDSLWYESKYLFRPDVKTDYIDEQQVQSATSTAFEFKAEWKPDTEYSLEIDSAAFVDIYGAVTEPIKNGIKVLSLDNYSSLMVTITGAAGRTLVVQLLDKQGSPIKQVSTKSGQAEFYYIDEGTYYLRAFADDNDNGVWDTGYYDQHRQPEPMYYFPEEIECREKWDVTREWNLMAKPLYRQKPSNIIKQKSKQKRTIRNKNELRAKQLGIKYDPEEIK